jgi:hypothetical protein
MALEGGVTVVGTGPGSANVLGGTFFAVKTHGKCVDEMILKDAVAMKCAFGENPKRCYKDKGNSARMTTASKLREMLFKAREYTAAKDAALARAWDLEADFLRLTEDGTWPAGTTWQIQCRGRLLPPAGQEAQP